ncbi:MAG: hypothetical protein ACREHG_03930 [Candidatus Saccharimonadales bacterium]
MREIINEKVSVSLIFNARSRRAMPRIIAWQNQRFRVDKIGFHHTVWRGRVLHHVFELVDQDETIWMRLDFNTENLHWTLEVISDGLAD